MRSSRPRRSRSSRSPSSTAARSGTLARPSANDFAGRVTGPGDSGYTGVERKRTMHSDPTKPLNGEIQSEAGKSTGADTDAGRTVLVGVLGGIISAAGYLVYQRLPDEQKDRLHRQVRGILESRINELRSNFNL